MIEFIDKTSEQGGTPINRENMMAIQGFVGNTTVFNKDGSITETNSKNQKLTTTFNKDGSITQTFEGEKNISKTTYFEGNVIREEIK